MILDTIVAHKREEVARLRSQGLGEPAAEIAPPRGFQQALIMYAGVAVIAEAKKASPSKGVICEHFDPQRIARHFQAGGAQAISVLTDERFFQGALSHIPLIRSTVDLPVLRKDFIIHPLQIEEARHYGADAVLLIAAILAQNQMLDLRAMAVELGMDVLVEVHDEQEVEKALAAGSTLIGINNRNLRDFAVDLETTFRLKREIPDHIPVVSESGICSRDDMQRLLEARITAALIGETLMRAKDPAAELRALRPIA
jgi:indole-3-glycerol phosphate synthase